MHILVEDARKVDSPDKRKIELSGRGMEHARAASLVCFVIQRRVTHSPALPLRVCTFVRSKTYSTVVCRLRSCLRDDTHTRVSPYGYAFFPPRFAPPPPLPALRFSHAFMQIFCTFVFLFLVRLYEKKRKRKKQKQNKCGNTINRSGPTGGEG